MTAASPEMWRGRTDARLEDVERRIDALNGQIEAVRIELAGVRLEVARQGTKVALGTAVAVLIAGPVVAVIAQALAS